MIRPQAARWFEILAARDDATLALAALAATATVELEARADGGGQVSLEETLPLLAEFSELSARYHLYWPQTRERFSAFPELAVDGLLRNLQVLRQWAAEAEAPIQRLQAIDASLSELRLWQSVLPALDGSPIDPGRLGRTGALLARRLVAGPAAAFHDLPAAALLRVIDEDEPDWVRALVVGTPEAVGEIERGLVAAKGQAHVPPDWLQADASVNRSFIASRLRALEREHDMLLLALQALQLRHDLPRALGDIHRVQWFVQHVHALDAGRLFCWITGWTSDLEGRRLAVALEGSGARAILHFPSPQVQLRARAPLLLVNAWWARPFEIFARALGMPAGNEADPSALLALVVPLMFGFMFGDVGQGLVVAVLGFVLRRRFPVARLLMAGGLSAIVFGLLFGSVFSIEAFEPLWLAPLADPITMLSVPLAGGAVLLLIGLLLGGVQAHWRGHFMQWLGSDPGLIVAYIALLLSPLAPSSLFVALAGVLFYCAGQAWHAGRLGALSGALAQLVERLLQLLINTLSFVRIGAFALAHAGLSAAIVALMDASDALLGKAAVLIGGNLLILTLEMMVVSIQTTRLVLFEFFTRFLTADGRAFRPLPPPPSIAMPQES